MSEVDVLLATRNAEEVLMQRGADAAADAMNQARAAVAELLSAAEFAVNALSLPGAPTRSEREDIIARLRVAIDNAGGAV